MVQNRHLGRFCTKIFNCLLTCWLVYGFCPMMGECVQVHKRSDIWRFARYIFICATVCDRVRLCATPCVTMLICQNGLSWWYLARVHCLQVGWTSIASETQFKCNQRISEPPHGCFNRKQKFLVIIIKKTVNRNSKVIFYKLWKLCRYINQVSSHLHLRSMQFLKQCIHVCVRGKLGNRNRNRG